MSLLFMLENGDQKAVSRLERRWVVGFAGLVLLITAIPYLIGFASQGNDWRFSGFVFGVEDGNSYISKMLSGTSGAWLFRTPYTAMRQSGVLMFLPYLLLGKLAAAPGVHEQLVALYQLFRVAASLLEMLAVYDFLAFFIIVVPLPRLGLVLAVLGGGLGWMLLLAGRVQLLGSIPLDFYSPETFGFLAIYGIPHLALARALMLWALLAYLRLAQSGHYAALPTRRGIVLLAALWLGSGLVQPLAPALVGVVIGLHLVAQAAWRIIRPGQAGPWNQWVQSLVVAALAGWPAGFFLIYNLAAVRSDPFLRIFSNQNLINSPSPLHYLLAYGLLLPYALLGGWRLLRRSAWPALLLIAWVAALPFLVYAPINLQRRLADGAWVGLVVLAVAALDGRLAARRLAWVPLLLAFPTSLMLLAGGILATVRPAEPVFLPVGETQAFNYLYGHAPADAVVLAAYETGNALPAWAPLRVVIGQGPESAGLERLRPQVAAFYKVGTSDNARQSLLQEQEVKYIFWGPQERALGSWNPSGAKYLQAIFSSEQVSIFEVAP